GGVTPEPESIPTFEPITIEITADRQVVVTPQDSGWHWSYQLVENARGFAARRDLALPTDNLWELQIFLTPPEGATLDDITIITPQDYLNSLHITADNLYLVRILPSVEEVPTPSPTPEPTPTPTVSPTPEPLPTPTVSPTPEPLPVPPPEGGVTITQPDDPSSPPDIDEMGEWEGSTSPPMQGPDGEWSIIITPPPGWEPPDGWEPGDGIIAVNTPLDWGVIVRPVDPEEANDGDWIVILMPPPISLPTPTPTPPTPEGSITITLPPTAYWPEDSIPRDNVNVELEYEDEGWNWIIRPDPDTHPTTYPPIYIDVWPPVGNQADREDIVVNVPPGWEYIIVSPDGIVVDDETWDSDGPWLVIIRPIPPNPPDMPSFDVSTNILVTWYPPTAANPQITFNSGTPGASSAIRNSDGTTSGFTVTNQVTDGFGSFSFFAENLNTSVATLNITPNAVNPNNFNRAEMNGINISASLQNNLVANIANSAGNITWQITSDRTVHIHYDFTAVEVQLPSSGNVVINIVEYYTGGGIITVAPEIENEWSSILRNPDDPEQTFPGDSVNAIISQPGDRIQIELIPPPGGDREHITVNLPNRPNTTPSPPSEFQWTWDFAPNAPDGGIIIIITPPTGTGPVVDTENLFYVYVTWSHADAMTVPQIMYSLNVIGATAHDFMARDPREFPNDTQDPANVWNFNATNGSAYFKREVTGFVDGGSRLYVVRNINAENYTLTAVTVNDIPIAQIDSNMGIGIHENVRLTDFGRELISTDANGDQRLHVHFEFENTPSEIEPIVVTITHQRNVFVTGPWWLTWTSQGNEARFGEIDVALSFSSIAHATELIAQYLDLTNNLIIVNVPRGWDWNFDENGMTVTAMHPTVVVTSDRRTVVTVPNQNTLHHGVTGDFTDNDPALGIVNGVGRNPQDQIWIQWSLPTLGAPASFEVGDTLDDISITYPWSEGWTFQHEFWGDSLFFIFTPPNDEISDIPGTRRPYITEEIWIMNGVQPTHIAGLRMPGAVLSLTFPNGHTVELPATGFEGFAVGDIPQNTQPWSIPIPPEAGILSEGQVVSARQTLLSNGILSNAWLESVRSSNNMDGFAFALSALPTENEAEEDEPDEPEKKEPDPEPDVVLGDPEPEPEPDEYPEDTYNDYDNSYKDIDETPAEDLFELEDETEEDGEESEVEDEEESTYGAEEELENTDEAEEEFEDEESEIEVDDEETEEIEDEDIEDERLEELSLKLTIEAELAGLDK
ncbi:MAG: hypothetical protein FWG65_07230, partial [Turicibacter sp.]|nr:hypothetical protein [Turicibacter sp.]